MDLISRYQSKFYNFIGFNFLELAKGIPKIKIKEYQWETFALDPLVKSMGLIYKLTRA